MRGGTPKTAAPTNGPQVAKSERRKWRFPLVSEKAVIKQDCAVSSDFPTKREQAQNDTASCKTVSDPSDTKNPDALAGAIGADLTKQASGKISTSRRIEYSLRTKRATALCEAIREAHPDDARQLLTAALADLEAGKPKPSRQDKVREDAKWWASMATPLELMEYTQASLSKLGEVALFRNHRKQLFARLWRQFSLDDQVAFLTKIKGGDL